MYYIWIWFFLMVKSGGNYLQIYLSKYYKSENNNKIEQIY